MVVRWKFDLLLDNGKSVTRMSLVGENNFQNIFSEVVFRKMLVMFSVDFFQGISKHQKTWKMIFRKYLQSIKRTLNFVLFYFNSCLHHFFATEQVSIPSQCRYVGYWASVLSVPRGVSDVPPDVNLPPKCSRELRRIRLYDSVNTTSVFFVVAMLQQIPNQSYCPAVEVFRGCCREIKKGYQERESPRYYLSFVEGDEGKNTESEEPHVVVQMDTESSMLYQKTCLDYHFNKPVQVSGDVRVIFYQKMIGSRLFYCCFNTAFIKNSLLQFSMRDLDKVGKQGRSVCGPAFCVELLFGPANPEPSLLSTSDDEEY